MTSSKDNPFVVEVLPLEVMTPRQITAESLARRKSLSKSSSPSKADRQHLEQHAVNMGSVLSHEITPRAHTPTQSYIKQIKVAAGLGSPYATDSQQTIAPSSPERSSVETRPHGPVGTFSISATGKTTIGSRHDAEVDRIIPKEAVVIQQVAGLGLHLINAGISIPEVVVVGPQSHGKSSVFQELTGLQFPTGQKRTTAFPIAVTVLYDSYESLQARIVFARPCDKMTQNRIIAFADKWQDKSIGQLADIVHEASSIMLQNGQCFSENELRISYASPKNHKTAVTYVDLPGLVCTDSDRFLVQTICEKHIKRNNVLILNVIQASTDIETSGGEALCKKFDALGRRTYSVATKIDHDVNEWVLEALRKQASMAEHDIEGPLLFFCRNKSAQENACGVSDEAFEIIREQLYGREPWASFSAYAGIYNLRRRASLWVEAHCGPAVKDLERLAADALQDARDEEAALPPTFPEVEVESRVIVVARKRLSLLFDELKKRTGEVQIAEMIAVHDQLNAAIGATKVIRQVRSQITEIVGSILGAEQLEAIRPLFLDNLVQDFQNYDIRVRRVLSLNPAVKRTLAKDSKLREALKTSIETEVLAPVLDKFLRTISEKILSNYELASSIVTGSEIIDDPITVQRRDLKRRIVTLEQVDEIMRKYRRR